MSRSTLTLAILSACTMLAACGDIPDFRAGERLDRLSNSFSSWRNDAPQAQAPVGAPLAPPPPAASAAEGACMQAGREAGFDVRGVVGTHEVTDAAGMPVSRDVMLQVQRGSQSLQVRCSYAYAGGEARIMTL
ncbi:MAG: hypothetical protein KDJ98_05695 [Rhodobacteraceae bacterium]|nr:hypothetical protein [Paracoccaceae bacterium]